jgi:hypothetical protein
MDLVVFMDYGLWIMDSSMVLMEFDCGNLAFLFT